MTEKRKYNKFDFEVFVKRLEEYLSVHGNLYVPVQYVCEDGYKLGRIVTVVREGRKKLKNSQKERLDSMQFVWDLKAFNFQLFVKKLQEYEKEHCDLSIPTHYVCADGYNLGVAVMRVRERSYGLDENQEKLLDDMGFVWKSVSTFNFERYYKKLIEYKEHYGNLLIHRSYICDEGYHLGTATWKVRAGYIKLTLIQRNLLDKLGFVWDVRLLKFLDFTEHLKQYKEIHGLEIVPNYYVCDDGYKLGEMVSRIRVGKRKVSAKEKEILDELGLELRIKYVENKGLTI